ncbi:phage tail assembly chaperone [Limnobacter sp.]|uniref:phage tail assembly chaperone n=1 Tax=Limnobacter sp. TaxID=2003368 RepID=UPI0025C4C5B9|nr:phage tail assembly chaperone [Limnobacter sp.]
MKLENITDRGLRIHSDGRINLTNAIMLEHGDNPQAWLINPETNVIEEWHEDNTITQPTADECDALRTKWTDKFKLSQLRHLRTKLLLETDHWAYQDAPTMTQAQIDYRQALRDLPANTTTSDIGFGTDGYGLTLTGVTWPTKP